jgi:hypothetical protein
LRYVRTFPENWRIAMMLAVTLSGFMKGSACKMEAFLEGKTRRNQGVTPKG